MEKLSKEKREMIIKSKVEIKKGIEKKQIKVEGLKRERVELEFKVDTIRPVKDLIKEAITLGIIEIKGVKKSFDPQVLDLCMSMSKEKEKSLKEELEDKKIELLNLGIEIIIDHQKLIVLKKDLEEESG